jgi:hypothetical protein
VSYLTVNGCECIRGKIVLPLTGAWVAEVVSDPDCDQGSFPVPGSTVTMNLGGQSFQGVVRRANAPYGTTFAMLIGGAGGLPSDIPALAYQSTTVQQVLSDILTAAGETLSTTSDQSLLGQNLASWVRIQGPAWRALTILMDSEVPDGTWRVLPDGSIWIGQDTWPQTSMSSFELLNYEPHMLRAQIYSDNPTIMAGQSFIGGHVTSIEHIVEPSKIHASVLFADLQLEAVEAL